MKGLTDIAGIRVGHISDYQAITGCTAILCEAGAVGGVDIRGSASGTTETPTLDPLHADQVVHAIVLAGGSAFGLEAASGVRRYLEARGVGIVTPVAKVPIVPAAILYDLGIGNGKIRPTAAMGEAAAMAATADTVAEGSVGAGTGATVGKALGIRQAMKGGIGSYTVTLPEGVLVAALVAANAFGDIRDPATGKTVAGARKSPESMEFANAEEVLKQRPAQPLVRTNTTLAVVATNAHLSKVEATKLAQFGSLGMARTIYPVNTLNDGDTIFALSHGDLRADINSLGIAAAEAVAAAILRAVKLAKGLAGVPGLG
ncbi:MAG: P1 family peptidase [Acidobacteriia bacterium]|nr:P1 family peptidase [Terriglobia bacterium]MBV8906101.1 P1 family peptidase [Terriglobia bacterium]